MITSNNKSPSKAKIFTLCVKCGLSVVVSSDAVHPFGPYLWYTCLLSGLAPFPTSVVLGEPPPPYSPQGSPDSSSAPAINCRVCQSAISVEGKMHQHVVKCGICNEATVSQSSMFLNSKQIKLLKSAGNVFHFKGANLFFCCCHLFLVSQ